MTRHRPLVGALLLDVVGAGAALLISIQTWQRLTAPRAEPFADARVEINGRDVDAAITALALVALAGVVAVLATHGGWRRVVGAIVALAGAGTIVRAAMSFGAVSNERALDFIASKRQTFARLPSTRAHAEVISAWPALTIISGMFVLAAGGLIAVRGGRWEGLSARYEAVAPAAVEATPSDEADGRAAATMWSALDRGEDPTNP